MTLAVRWLLGEDYATAEVRFAKDTRRTHAKLRSHQIMILTTKSGVRIDVEAFVNNGNNYEIKCEAVCEDAVLNLPEPSNITVTANATKEGRMNGPTAWDGYCGQVAAAVASKARDTQTIVNSMPGGTDSWRNWIVLTAIYGSLAAVAMLFCFACVRERAQVLDEYGEEKIPLKEAIPALFKNK